MPRRTLTQLTAATAVAAALVVAATALAAGGSTSAPSNQPSSGTPRGTVVAELPERAGARYLSLSTMDFAPDSIRFESGLDYFNRWGFDRLFGPELSNEDPLRCFNASVHLPERATMTAAVFYYRSGPRSDLYATIVRQDLAAGSTERFVEVFPQDDSGDLMSETVLVPTGPGVIRNARYAYGVGVCPVHGTTFNGVTIQYVEQ